MLFDDMKRECRVLYESIHSSDAPGFFNSEWQDIFNIAQREFIWDLLKKGFTRDAFSMRMLEPITIYDSDNGEAPVDYFLNTDDSAANGYTLNTAIFWILDEYIEDDNNARIPLKRITYDFYQANINNPYKKPELGIDKSLWVLSSAQSDNYNTVVVSDGSLSGPIYHAIGVYHPDENKIDMADGYTNGCCKLAKSAHPLIVKRAVDLAYMAVIDPEGYQLRATDDQIKRNY